MVKILFRKTTHEGRKEYVAAARNGIHLTCKLYKTQDNFGSTPIFQPVTFCFYYSSPWSKNPENKNSAAFSTPIYSWNI